MPPRVELTDREQEIARLLCASNPPLTMRQIAIRLGVAETTLKGNLTRLIDKFNVVNTRQLTVLLLQNELQNSQIVAIKRAGEDCISSTVIRKSSPELAAEQLRHDGISYVAPEDAPEVIARFLSYHRFSYTISSSSSSRSCKSPPDPN